MNKICAIGCAIVLTSLVARADFKEELRHYNFTQTRGDALIIAKDGQIIFEEYAPHWPPEKPHILWSATKSLTNIMVGIAVKDRRVSLDESICKKIDELRGSEYCQIKVFDLLSHSSGLRWNEIYESSIAESSPISMLYGPKSGNMTSFVLSAPHSFDAPAGTRWMYSTGDTNLLDKVLQRSYRKEAYDTLPWSRWAKKLGIKSLTLEQDLSGAFVGGSYGYLTARDFWRWGEFMLNDGRVHGKRLLPRGWIERSTRVSPGFLRGRAAMGGDEIPGLNWWINRSVPELNARPAYKYAPEDFYKAHGHWGQILGIIPSEKIVVARLGNDRVPRTFNVDEFMRLVRQVALNKSIPQNDAIAGNPELVTPYESGLNYEEGIPRPARELELFGAYRAKDFCSCYFVAQQSKEYCTDFVENPTVPSALAPIEILPEEKTIRVNGYVALFQNRRLGCVLKGKN